MQLFFTRISFGLGGFVLGVIATRLAILPAPSLDSVTEPATPQPPVGADRESELAQAREQIEELTREIARRATAAAPIGSPAPLATASSPTVESSAAPAQEHSPPSKRVAWRISAIEKFVPLSEEQKNRLTVKFEREAAGEESSASLEEILGGESATFYREQVKAAFERARNEEVDREIVWLGRQLALTSAQERDIKVAFDAVEKELETVELPESVQARTPEERVKAMITENKRREELRQARLKMILSPDQFAAYSRMNAESTKSDIEVFHGENS